MHHSTGGLCVFYLRSHIVWSMTCRDKVLRGHIRLRVHDTCRQVCAQNGADIIRGLSAGSAHICVLVLPKLAIGCGWRRDAFPLTRIANVHS